MEGGRYWEYGPFPFWNTSPAGDCRDNPVTPADSLVPGVELYISFPAKRRPTYSGSAEIADGEFPVVVFTHANNDSVCNIFERYYTLLDHLASWGYIAISVDSTEDNCQSGTRQNIIERSDKQLAAVQALRAYNEDPTSPFYGKIDLSQIVLAGHSRGGGASIVSWLETDELITGIIDFQGVDTTGFGFGTPDITIPVLSFSASKDDDLNYPYVEPQEAQLKEAYTWVTIVGGIHAWTADTVPIRPNDSPAIKQHQQHDIQEYFVTAFLLNYIGTITRNSNTITPISTNDVLFSHKGIATVASNISEKGVWVRWNKWGPLDVLIDDFQKESSAEPDPATNLLGGDNTASGFERAEEVLTYYPDSDTTSAMYKKHKSLLLMPAEGSVGTYTMDFSNVPIFVEEDMSFQASVKSRDDMPFPSQVTIIFHSDAEEYSFDLSEYVGVIPLENRLGQVVIPFSEITSTSFALNAVTLEFDNNALLIDNPMLVKEQ
ncbi:MAG: alpha/beta hydrolase family protein [Myxococcota bacterium]